MGPHFFIYHTPTHAANFVKIIVPKIAGYHVPSLRTIGDDTSIKLPTNIMKQIMQVMVISMGRLTNETVATLFLNFKNQLLIASTGSNCDAV